MIDPGTKEKRESIAVNTDVVQENHHLHDSSRARRENQGRLNTFRTERNTEVGKGIRERKGITIEGQAGRRSGRRMVKDTALGWIPTVAKGIRVIFTERQQGRDRRSGTKDGNIISEQEAIQRNGRRRGGRGGRRDTMSS